MAHKMVATAARESEVTLHVYSLGTTSALKSANKVMHKLGTGVFHAGVEVHGVEYFFVGHASETGVGIRSCVPGACAGHKHFKALPMGKVRLSRMGVLAIITQMSSSWTMETYHLLTRNCCHFALEFMRHLGVELSHAPKWLLRSSRLAARMSLARVWRAPAFIQDHGDEKESLMPCVQPRKSIVAALSDRSSVLQVLSSLSQTVSYVRGYDSERSAADVAPSMCSKLALALEENEVEKLPSAPPPARSSRASCAAGALSLANSCWGMSVRVSLPRRHTAAEESQTQRFI